MNEEKYLILKAGLSLTEQALSQLQQVDNATVKHIASMLQVVLHVGDLVLGIEQDNK